MPTTNANTATAQTLVGTSLLGQLSVASSHRAPSVHNASLPAPQPEAPFGGAGAPAEAGSSSSSSSGFAALLMILALVVAQLVGRRRLSRELARPTPFVLLPADPG
jgi:uncharacterized protein (TIGR03382 family)